MYVYNNVCMHTCKLKICTLQFRYCLLIFSPRTCLFFVLYMYVCIHVLCMYIIMYVGIQTYMYVGIKICIKTE